jgi:branched-chain amino acid transport system permease protein
MAIHPTGVYNVRYKQEIEIARTGTQKALMACAIAALAVLPPLFLSNSSLAILIIIGINIVAMQGLNILFGYTGQISIGHSAFIGVGAYASALLAERLGFPFLAAFLGAGLVSALLGLVFALPSVRVKGFYLAITTLGAYFILIWVMQHWSGLTGGIYGLSVPRASLAGVVLDTEPKFYLFTLAIVLLSTFAAKNLIRSHVGRAFVAVRDNDLAAAVMGVNVFRYKCLAFFICCFYAGLAGSMWAHYIISIHPEQFPFVDSIWYLGFLAVGGMGSIMGPIFGTLLWRLLQEWVAALVPLLSDTFPALAATAYSGVSLVIFGLVVMVFLMFEPRGINHRWTIFKSYYRLWPFSY